MLISIPLLLIRRDIAKVFARYQFNVSEALQAEKKQEYVRGAEEVFAAHPDVAVFIYGHTHAADVEKCAGRLIVNTGTWLKKLTYVTSRFYLLPAVYCPSYRLGYFKIDEEDGKLAIRYVPIAKDEPPDLSLLQRLSIYGKRRGASQLPPPLTLYPE